MIERVRHSVLGNGSLTLTPRYKRVARVKSVLTNRVCAVYPKTNPIAG